MITVETAQAAISVAEELDKRTIFLTPVSGTPVDQLRIQSTLAEEASRDLEYKPDASMISSLSALGDDVHGIQLEQFSDEIARSVQNHLNFAKNIVKPAIQQVSDKLQVEYEKLASNLQFDLEIIQVDPPEPMVVSSFEDMVTAYKDITYIPFEGGYIPCTTVFTAPSFIDLLKTANTDIDQAISVWAAKKGDKFFDNVINSLFNAGTKSIQSMIDDNDEGTDVALAVFLATNKLHNNPPEGVRMTLSSYNASVDELRKQAAFKLNQSYLVYARNTNSKLLIVKYNNTQVFVNGNIYRDWLESGGNNAAIFGSILSSNPKLFLNDINEKQREYIENWESKNRLMTASIKSKSFIYKKEALRNTLINVAQSNFKEYFGHLVEEGAQAGTDLPEYQTFLKLTDEFVDSVKESDLLNIWSLSTKSVCDCMFFYTSAHDILEGIDEAFKVNPGITIREALLLSTIEYVTNYVCNQITVSS